MAEGAYDEVTNTVYQGDSAENMDPMFHWDLHFPERISRLRLNPEFSSPASRRQRRPRDRCAVRYKTQPITFDEITEVDEDVSAAAAAVPVSEGHGITEAMKVNFKNTMTGFSRSMDGLVAGCGSKKAGSTGPVKENITSGHGDDRVSRKPQDNAETREEDVWSHLPPAKELLPPSDCSKSVGYPSDGARQRRRRLNRKLHHRNTVEEVPEPERAEGTEEP